MIQADNCQTLKEWICKKNATLLVLWATFPEHRQSFLSEDPFCSETNLWCKQFLSDLQGNLHFAVLCSQRSQKTGPATGLQAGTHGFGSAKPSHGQTVAAAASGKGRGEEILVRKSTVHMNCVMCRNYGPCGGWRLCWAHCCHPCLRQLLSWGLLIWVSGVLCFLKFVVLFCFFFPWGLIVTHRSHVRAEKNAFIGQCLIQSCCTATGCRRQTRRGVTCNTCG